MLRKLLLLCPIVAGCGPDVSEPAGPGPTPELPRLTVAVLEPQGPASLAVGATLAPLRILVRFGTQPVAGLELTWTSSSGTFSQKVSVTGTDGTASTSWRAGSRAETASLGVRTQDGFSIPLLSVRVDPGPTVMIEKVAGDGQVIGTPALYAPQALVARTRDSFGNWTIPQSWTWEVVSGPAVLIPPLTAFLGTSVAPVRGTGSPGPAVIVARPSGTGLEAVFTLEFVPDVWEVGIVNVGYTDVTLQSYQNLSSPAVDTIPLGGTLVIRNRDSWDVIQGGGMQFPPAAGPMDCNWTVVLEPVCRVTLVTPGTFEYSHSQYPSVRGTVIVR